MFRSVWKEGLLCGSKATSFRAIENKVALKRRKCFGKRLVEHFLVAGEQHYLCSTLRDNAAIAVELDLKSPLLAGRQCRDRLALHRLNEGRFWRTDPAQSGPSFIVGDLGTHCFHLSEFVTGQRVAALAADLQTMVPGRRLKDNAHILLRYDNGARGAMWVSAVAAGEQVGLRLRVYGEKGHIAWEQSDPDKLRFALQGEASRTLVRGQSGLSSAAKRATRIAAGLPESYLEAFATLYLGRA